MKQKSIDDETKRLLDDKYQGHIKLRDSNLLQRYRIARTLTNDDERQLYLDYHNKYHSIREEPLSDGDDWFKDFQRWCHEEENEVDVLDVIQLSYELEELEMRMCEYQILKDIDQEE